MGKFDSIVSLTKDLRNGVETFSYEDRTLSRSQVEDAIRNALIDANGGEKTFNRKAFRRNKVEIFELIEELVPAIVNEEHRDSDFWQKYVDERNLSEGDSIEFDVQDNSLFVVSEIADGIATPRRQRIVGNKTYTLNPVVHSIRMYDEFSRFMAGRINWLELCDKVAKSFDAQIWNDIYAVVGGIDTSSTGLTNTYIKSGTYDEETLMELIEHVEAANNASAVIVGSKLALSKCKGVLSDEAKSKMFSEGYYGNFNGTPMITLKQSHKAGTSDFVLPKDAIYVFASDDKFIKYVTRGETWINEKDVTANADKTIEYLMEMEYAVGISVNGPLGKYTFTAG